MYELEHVYNNVGVNYGWEYGKGRFPPLDWLWGDDQWCSFVNQPVYLWKLSSEFEPY